MAAEFRTVNPGAEVTFNFAGSPTLRAQLEQGARADVYASADMNQMERAVKSGVVDEGVKVFVRNSLVIIAPKDNPGSILSPVDLRRDGLKLVFANEDVPAGAYARQVLAAMERDPAYGAGFSDDVLDNVISLESNVKQVVAKVELGEADAGIVYRTDVSPSLAPKLATIAIPPQFNVVAEYPIALTKDARNRRTAEAFIEFVFSQTGRAILQSWGFESAG
jgi:molybdate transport system substrate-binding protein